MKDSLANTPGFSLEMGQIIANRHNIIVHVKNIIPHEPLVKRIGNKLRIRDGAGITRLERKYSHPGTIYEIQQLFKLRAGKVFAVSNGDHGNIDIEWVIRTGILSEI